MANEENQIKEINASLAGKWREVRNESLDDFYKELGLNFFWRKLACQIKPEMEIIVDGPNIGVNFKTASRTEVFKYKLNGEVGIERDNNKYNVTTTYQDGKLTTNQVTVTGDLKKPMVTVREVTPAGELLTTNLIGDVVCKRYFEKIE